MAVSMASRCNGRNVVYPQYRASASSSAVTRTCQGREFIGTILVDLFGILIIYNFVLIPLIFRNLIIEVLDLGLG